MEEQTLIKMGLHEESAEAGDVFSVEQLSNHVSDGLEDQGVLQVGEIGAVPGESSSSARVDPDNLPNVLATDQLSRLIRKQAAPLSLPSCGPSLELLQGVYERRLTSHALVSAEQYLLGPEGSARLSPASKAHLYEKANFYGLRIEDLALDIVLEESRVAALNSVAGVLQIVMTDFMNQCHDMLIEVGQAVVAREASVKSIGEAQEQKLIQLNGAFKTTSDVLVQHLVDTTDKIEQRSKEALVQFTAKSQPLNIEKKVADKAVSLVFKMMDEDFERMVKKHIHAHTSKYNWTWLCVCGAASFFTFAFTRFG